MSDDNENEEELSGNEVEPDFDPFTAYLVGETGRELFYPIQRYTIVPSGEVGRVFIPEITIFDDDDPDPIIA